MHTELDLCMICIELGQALPNVVGLDWFMGTPDSTMEFSMVNTELFRWLDCQHVEHSYDC